MIEAIHIIVYGRVQGVWFRAGSKERAGELGVFGWVKNRPGGTVEIHAEGEKDNLREGDLSCVTLFWHSDGIRALESEHVYLPGAAVDKTGRGDFGRLAPWRCGDASCGGRALRPETAEHPHQLSWHLQG